MGPFLVGFMVLSKLKTSTELNKMASIERDSKFTRRPWAYWTYRKYTDYNMHMSVLHV